MLPHPPGSAWKGVAFHDHHCQGVGDSPTPFILLEVSDESLPQYYEVLNLESRHGNSAHLPKSGMCIYVQGFKGDVSSPFADPEDDERNVHSDEVLGVGISQTPLSSAWKVVNIACLLISRLPFWYQSRARGEQNVHSFSSHSETDTPKQGELQSSPNGSFGNYLTILRHLTRKNYGTSRDKLCTLLSLRFQRS